MLILKLFVSFSDLDFLHFVIEGNIVAIASNLLLTIVIDLIFVPDFISDGVVAVYAARFRSYSILLFALHALELEWGKTSFSNSLKLCSLTTARAYILTSTLRER